MLYHCNVIRNWLTSASGQEPEGVCPRRLSITHDAKRADKYFLTQRTRGEVLHARLAQPGALAGLLPSLTKFPMPPSSGTPDSSSQFKAILDTALNEYKTKTGNDPITNSLAKEIQSCDSAAAVLDIIQREAKAFDKFRDGDKRLMKWIGPLVDVLYTISPILSAGVSIVRTIRVDSSCDETLLCSRFLLPVRSLPASDFSSPFVHPFIFLSAFLIPMFYRQQGMCGRATMCSSTSLSASSSSSSALGFILRFLRPRR